MISLKNIYVLYGGPSVEHEISITSALSVIRGLDREKYRVYPVYVDKQGRFFPQDEGETEEELTETKDIDRNRSLAAFLSEMKTENTVLFPVMHGTYGEDGTIQGLLELLNLPYTGDGVLASALCMDKGYLADVFEKNDIPQADYLVAETPEQYRADYISERISLPVYIKPCNSGSSVGVHFVEKEEELERAVADASRYDNRVLIQKAVDGHELQIAVIGNEKPLASRPGVYGVPEDYSFFDYEAKYNDDNTKLIVPFPMEKETEEKARTLAEKAYRIAGCEGYARVDIFLSEKGLLVNEINTCPGMTSHSMFPRLWSVTEEIGCPPFSDVLDRIIALGEERFEKDNEKVVDIK